MITLGRKMEQFHPVACTALLNLILLLGAAFPESNVQPSTLMARIDGEWNEPLSGRMMDASYDFQLDRFRSLSEVLS